MARRANPALIGAFVIGAVVLAIIGVLVFGGARFLQEKRYFVTFFDGTVTGLRVGSNVLFRGVRVGYVTDISILADEDLDRFAVQVTYQILPDAFTVLRGSVRTEAGSRRIDVQKDLIDRGLRAKLEVESFVTGQLIVQLDFYPDQEVAPPPAYDSPYPAVPSVPSGIQEALANVQKFLAELESTVDLEQLMTNLQGTFAGLNQLANSPDLAAAIAGVSQIVNDPATRALPGTARQAFAAVGETAGAAQSLIARADAELIPALAEARQAFRQFDQALAQATAVMEVAQGQLGQDSDLSYQLSRTLRETQAVARSLRVLTDLLERNPEALLRGKRDQ